MAANFGVPSLTVYDSTSSVSSDEYEWDCNEIIDGLYLGSLAGAVDKHGLSTADISCMVTLLKESEVLLLHDHNIVGTSIRKTNWLYIDIQDRLKSDIFQQFEKTNQFLETKLHDENRNILVHCLAGISRSTTIVCAYLMYSQEMSLDDALQLCQSKRRVASPNFAFLEQLQRYEIHLKELRGESVDEDNVQREDNDSEDDEQGGDGGEARSWRDDDGGHTDDERPPSERRDGRRGGGGGGGGSFFHEDEPAPETDNDGDDEDSVVDDNEAPRDDEETLSRIDEEQEQEEVVEGGGTQVVVVAPPVIPKSSSPTPDEQPSSPFSQKIVAQDHHHHSSTNPSTPRGPNRAGGSGDVCNVAGCVVL